jgi:hypothetical protein
MRIVPVYSNASSQLHAPTVLPTGGTAFRTHWIGGCVDPRTGLVDVEEWKYLTIPGPEPQALGHAARSQSLYRLGYRGSL